MERKIGEIFEYNGEWYQCVVAGFSCADCDIKGDCSSTCIGACSSRLRKDGKQVRFKKLEKVGEPYEFDGHLFQSYRTFEVPIFTENYATVRELGNNSKISIEIKQNKEDMEEKKQKLDDLVGLYSSAQITYKEFDKELKALYTQQGEEDKPVLKSFNLEEAKEGKPVCTRDGRKARIICFDKGGEQPIVALIEKNEEESIDTFFSNGHSISKTNKVPGDLMMLPEKKEGWVNVYMEETNNNERLAEQVIYKTRKDAFDNACPRSYKATVKIEWEE